MKKTGIILVMMLISMIMLAGAGAQSNTGYLTETLLNQDSDPAEPGEYVEIRWKVTKYGNEELKDIQYELAVEYPFSFDGSDEPVKSLGNWKGFSEDNEYYTLFYKLKVDGDALEDTYDLTLRKKHSDSIGWSASDYEVRVGEKKSTNLVIGDVVSSPKKLVSDTKEAELDIELTNIGNDDAENVKAELEMPSGFKATYSYSDRTVLGTIEAGSSKTVNFFVDVGYDVSGAKSYQATLKVMYKEADEEVYKEINLPVSLNIKERPIFTVKEIKTNPSVITPGSEFTIFVTLENSGGREAESVSVRAFKDSTQPFEFEEKTNFIGTLGPNTTGEGVFRLIAEEGATPKRYQLDMEIRSIDGDNVLIDEKTLAFSVQNSKEPDITATDSSPLVGILVIALVTSIGTTLYFAFKKKK